MSDRYVSDLGSEAKKVLKGDAKLTVEQVGTLVAEIKRLRYQAAQVGGGKNKALQERDEYKGAYLRIKEAIANERDNHSSHNTPVQDALTRIEAVLPEPITPEEKNMLFGVENRARRQEAANFELGKEIAGMIRRGADTGDILEMINERQAT